MQNILGLSLSDILLLENEGIILSNLDSLTKVSVCDKDGNYVSGKESCGFIVTEILEEIKNDLKDSVYLSDVDICLKYGITILCESPLEIKLLNGDFASNGFASMLINNLRLL